MRVHPIEFRAKEVTQVMQFWRAAESCTLVGVGSVGKSNLLHHLSNPDTQAHYLGAEHTGRFRAINIDPNMLGPLEMGEANLAVRAWAGYELMMHRLFISFYPFDALSPEDAKLFYTAYQTLQDGTNPLYAYMGLRYFELGLELCLRTGMQIVFMFDEFEEMMTRMPVKFFQTLRGLRDQHKHQLSYLTFTRSPLSRIANNLGISPVDFEPFKELFNDNVVFVGPYSEQDARAMLTDLAASLEIELNPSLHEFLLSVSGGFAGLLRSAFHQVAERGMTTLTSAADVDKLASTLLRDTGIRAECQTIWDSLLPSEQIVLMAVARLASYAVDAESEQAVALLVKKKLLLVDRHANRLEIRPPLFRLFVEAEMMS